MRLEKHLSSSGMAATVMIFKGRQGGGVGACGVHAIAPRRAAPGLPLRYPLN
jgi:hypothetical protein